MTASAQVLSNDQVPWYKVPSSVDAQGWPRNKGLRKLGCYIATIYVVSTTIHICTRGMTDLCVQAQLLSGWDSTATSLIQVSAAWNTDLGFPGTQKSRLITGIPCESVLV